MTRRRRALGAALVGVTLLVLSEPAFAQCAMCRRALASPEGRQLVAAFRSGILFLLAVPLVTFATVATLAVRRQRRREADRAALIATGPDARPYLWVRPPDSCRSAWSPGWKAPWDHSGARLGAERLGAERIDDAVHLQPAYPLRIVAYARLSSSSPRRR
jgi:hypothetical protein